MKDIINGEIKAVVFNSLTDNGGDVNLEDPKTYWDVVLVHKLDLETGDIYVYRQDVDALIHEKEKKAQSDAALGLRIESFTSFLYNKYGKENIYCLPVNKSLIVESFSREK